MQREGRHGDGWGRVGIAMMGVERAGRCMAGHVFVGDVSGGWP